MPYRAARHSARNSSLVRAVLVTAGLQFALVVAGCQSAKPGNKSAQTARASESNERIRQVVQVFDQRPWLNLDSAGDRDYEGVKFRVFLSGGEGRGVLCNGKLHVEMYRVRKDENGHMERELVSDWHYETKDIPRIAEPGRLGDGYYPHLRWARKDIAGSEVEIITQFESSDGRVIRSATKRLRVPKYDS